MSENTNEIRLTLDPFAPEEEKKAEVQVPEVLDEAALKKLDDLTLANLTEEERKTVEEFSEKIDITDTAVTLQYGAGTQQKIAEFSDNALQSVRTQDLGQSGEMIAALVGELKGFSDDIDDAGKRSLFKKAAKKVTVLKAKYDKVETSVENITSALDKHQVTLLKDVAVLDKLYETNLNHFKELSMYITAGKMKLEKERSTTLIELQERARVSGLPEDAQKANDFASLCTRFEKKIYDLELTRAVSIQMAPQIRLVQNNDILMSEKIQSTIVNTIPLWKSQMILTLGLAHSEEALKAEQAVTEMTNELLKKNAQMLHQSSVQIAKESERGIIDIETLTQTNTELINTLDEVLTIRNEGHAKRQAAEAELGRIEEELKNKLLEIKG